MNGTVIVLLAAAGIVAMLILGSWVAAQKGRSEAEGSLLGLLLGPFGVLIEALLPSKR